MISCNIIGISDSRQQWFPPHVADIIRQGKVFSGGTRHHEIMQEWLPEEAVWIDITIPLKDVFEEYARHKHIVIFASGDPFFYGFASTVQRELPDCKITAFPAFNSLQMLAHRMCLPYQNMHVISLTGRPWDKFDEALIHGYSLIGCLTDRNKTPHAIMQRMLDYGYSNYNMTIGENLGNEQDERVSQYSKDAQYDVPNCIILQRTEKREHPFGISEDRFELLDGRAKMITKMPIRLVSLAAMNLRQCDTMWDVGFCTGSVSIEARLQFPHLKIVSFEIRPEGEKLMDINARRFGAPGIDVHIGDFLSADLSSLPRPDAVFIGGHGGKLKEMVIKISQTLNPGGCIVFNSVSESSRQLFIESVAATGMTIVQENCITVDDHNPIHIMKAQ